MYGMSIHVLSCTTSSVVEKYEKGLFTNFLLITFSCFLCLLILFQQYCLIPHTNANNDSVQNNVSNIFCPADNQALHFWLSAKIFGCLDKKNLA